MGIPLYADDTDAPVETTPSQETQAEQGRVHPITESTLHFSYDNAGNRIKQRFVERLLDPVLPPIGYRQAELLSPNQDLARVDNSQCAQNGQKNKKEGKDES